MRIVAALGGNALLRADQQGTLEEQVENIRVACRQLARLARHHELVITHGNGPQIGKIHLQNELARGETPAMPLDICGAMSQGQIGYLLQQQLKNELARAGIPREVVTVVTQVMVDPEDPSFSCPTKPIGSFYSRQEAERFMREKGEKWVEDSGRGWRKVVPSPRPREIVEGGVIRMLVERACLVIAAGGGGIPVIKGQEGSLGGIEAVIDKDLASELLAEIVEADALLILTDVPRVYLHYGKPGQAALDEVTVEEMERYEAAGHFAAGSMGPKVRAAVCFARRRKRRAVITSLEKAAEALEGREGTHIVPHEISYSAACQPSWQEVT